MTQFIDIDLNIHDNFFISREIKSNGGNQGAIR